MSYLLLRQESESRFLETDASTLPMRSITVLIVDDHALIRSAVSQSLISLGEIRLVVTAKNYTEAEEQVAKLFPDIIWLDMHIDHSDSIEEIYRLRKLAPASRIMALTDEEDEQEAFAAIMAGVQGYRSKQDVDLSEIMTMIHMICRGEFVLSTVLMTRMMQHLRATAMPLWVSENSSGSRTLPHNTELNGLSQLTIRQREILQLICRGYRDRDIAKGLHISVKTVQKHVMNILDKLGVQNRTEAAYLIRSLSVI
jgi:DNA-binding NarL/FixJ family response regulator